MITVPGNTCTCTSEGKFPISTFQNKIFGRFKIFSSKDIYMYKWTKLLQTIKQIRMIDTFPKLHKNVHE